MEEDGYENKCDGCGNIIRRKYCEDCEVWFPNGHRPGCFRNSLKNHNHKTHQTQ